MKKSRSNNSLERDFSFEEILQKLEYFCAYQERSESEVIQKFEALQADSSWLPAALIHLKSNKFLDEERYVAAVVSGKFRIKQWGRQKIKAYLISKRIPAKQIQTALLELDDEVYHDTLRNLAERKVIASKLDLSLWKDRQKLIAYLVTRGYEMDLVLTFINEVDM